MPNRLTKTRRVTSQAAASSLPAEFYRQIADTIPHMVWAARPDGALDFFNAQVYSYTGLTRAQLAGWGWRAVIHPEDWPRCLNVWTQALKAERPYEIEYRLRRHDGAYLWHTGAALPHKAGTRVVRWFGTCTDIDPQKRAARLLEQARQTLESLVATRTQALEESGHRLRMFLDSMPAIAWIKDAQLRYVWTSASYSRVFGKSLAEIQGKRNVEIWPAESAGEFSRDDEKALRANGPVQSIHFMRCADGTTARMLVVKFPLPELDGSLGVATIAFDLGPSSAAALGFESDVANPLETLSARERQVLQLIVDGRTSAEAGELLNLSPKSVETYRSRLMAKLRLEDLPALVKFAIRHGLTTIR
jgi:PAS domain S-box-containing protein